MKTHFTSFCRAWSPAALAAVMALVLAPAPAALAKDNGKGNKGGHENKGPAKPAHMDNGHGKGGHMEKGPGPGPAQPGHGKKEGFVVRQEPKFEKKVEKNFAPKVDKHFTPQVVPKFVPHIHPKMEKARVAYLAHPRSAFVLAPGVGYAGRGYYYGPPHSPYYYESPGVRYFARREDFPSGYAMQPGYQPASDELAVQEALARLGYYQGPIDGRIGPQTLNAIAQYEQDHDMGITNAIVPALLQALGLQ